MNRDIAEKMLLDAVQGRIIPLGPESIPLIAPHRDGTFGRSYLAYQLYANGQNAHSTSTHHPRGLLFSEAGNIAGVGVFFRPTEPQTPCIHLIAPHGPDWAQQINQLADDAQLALPGAKFFLRQLSFDQYKELGVEPNLNRIYKLNPGAKWTAIEADPWLFNPAPGASSAIQEDETFSNSRIVFADTLRSVKDGAFNNITGISRNSRDMARRNFNGFHNFLERNDLEFALLPYTPELRADCRELVHGHFARLENAGRAIGSTAADYENLLGTYPCDAPDGSLHMFAGVIRPKANLEEKRTMSFFGFEEIQARGMPRECGGYATITSYDITRLDGLVKNPKGFNQIATYAMGQLLHNLQAQGIAAVQLGGSETRTLDDGKAKIGANPVLTYWAVKKDGLQNASPGKDGFGTAKG